MNDQSQFLLRSIKGPVIMITVGVLFAADRFTAYRFHQTWPVLLIVIGLLQLLGGRRRRGEFHRSPGTSYQAPFMPPTPNPTPDEPEEPRS